MVNPTTEPSVKFDADSVLSPYVYVFIAAYLLSFVMTPIMRRVAEYYGVIDKPDPRKMHSQPVAYLGGVAVFIGWVGGLAISQFTGMHYWSAAWNNLPVAHHILVYPQIVIAAFMIVALGLWDDLRSINPKLKIIGQIAAAVVLIAGHVGTHSTEPLLRPIFLRFALWGHPLPAGLIVHFTSCALIIGLVVFCCNATNLMDGLDGLCGGVTAIIAGGYVFLVVNLAINLGTVDVNLNGLRIVLALALLGAVLGFVPFNFNPASIFMGDTGSMFLGFALAVLILLMAEVDSRWLLASLVMFALPVLDTSLAFARRMVNKRPVFSADKHHFHHQLVSRGMTVRRAVVVSYALAIAFTVMGALIVFLRTRFAVCVYMVTFGSIVVAAYKMGMVHERTVVVEGGKTLGAGEVMTPTTMEPGAVMEIRDKNER
jgi:UDP-GlcNAc:undecaprenyl-phosphate/decaprenyl-phosphate GlcNAc-1-phosphate transferase